MSCNMGDSKSTLTLKQDHFLLVRMLVFDIKEAACLLGELEINVMHGILCVCGPMCARTIQGVKVQKYSCSVCPKTELRLFIFFLVMSVI